MQQDKIPKMKNLLELSFILMLMADLLLSCTGNSQFDDQGSGGWMPMMHYGSGYGGGMFMWFILLVVIGVGAYFFIQSQKTKDQGSAPTPNESHLDILKKRYAKGEITKEEYEQMKNDLER